MASDESQPLLHDVDFKSNVPSVNIQHWQELPLQTNVHQSSKQKARQFLSCKYGHYFVLSLVCLDVTGIFLGFVIRLIRCEGRYSKVNWNAALQGLSIISLVFSCLFMLELLASIWAFGLRYFHSKFHCFDALVITAGLILDISLQGVEGEAASLIVVLRLWRVFKIIEELTVGEEEAREQLTEAMEQLRGENNLLRQQMSFYQRRVEHSEDAYNRQATPPTPD